VQQAEEVNRRMKRKAKMLAVINVSTQEGGGGGGVFSGVETFYVGHIWDISFTSTT
jgi:hypothetical protein